VGLAVVLAAGGCDGGSGDADGEATGRVYVSLPLRGAAGLDGRDAADGARLALADAGGEAGGLAIEAVVLDDTEGSGQRARWTPERAAANARAATQDSSALAYLGELESGATRGSLPITNEARMLQVSPASGAVDLVAPFPGTDEVPEVQPSGERSFGRVIPADDAQAAAAAAWAAELEWEAIAIESDHSRFGEALASAFEDEARSLGLAIEPGGRAGFTYLALGPGTGAGAAAGGGGEPTTIASDAFLPPYARPGAVAGPLLVTSAALDPAQLPPAGRDLAERFEAEYGRPPGRYAAYGYEAMAVILDSIERAGDPADREAVIEAFFDTAERDSVLGTYSIDEVGDTTLGAISGYELERGAGPRPVAELDVGRQ
jgi:branched-chain amino acid transport system substrate-binding protein